MRISGTALVAGLVLSSTLVLPAASGAAVTPERGGRSYHTLTKIKKTKVQACTGPARATGAGVGVPLYIKLNNKRSSLGAFARVTTNLLDRDYNAAPHKVDAGKYAIVAPDELVRVEASAHHRTVNVEIVASAIGGC